VVSLNLAHPVLIYRKLYSLNLITRDICNWRTNNFEIDKYKVTTDREDNDYTIIFIYSWQGPLSTMSMTIMCFCMLARVETGIDSHVSQET